MALIKLLNEQRMLLSVGLFFVLLTSQSCKPTPDYHGEMLAILKKSHREISVAANPFYPYAKLTFVDSMLSLSHNTPEQVRYCKYFKSNVLLQTGDEDQAIQLFSELVKSDTDFALQPIWRDLALAYLRKGERTNCISNHAAESCILPIKGMGIHVDEAASRKAIEIFERLLTINPDDLESRWLLNLAYMTIGEYPKGLSPKFLIPGMGGDTTYTVQPFQDIAGNLKLDINNMAGGSVVEDFDNDGYLDIMTTGWGSDDEMNYYKNDATGSFVDLSDKTGLKGITGGLNMVQADYNKDGFMDVFVLRGAWKHKYGKEPNSLLRNNGDGTFTDVTKQSGLLSFHPTQTATWNDFNNDGWIDLFIGNETTIEDRPAEIHPCELYINNQDGTFKEVAVQAKCAVKEFVKGVTSGDYDNDGWKDIFISTMSGRRILLKNNGDAGETTSFTDVTLKAGIDLRSRNTFPTWFWDYDNDGWLDIFACDYTVEESVAYLEAAEKLNIAAGYPEKMFLYRNNHDGTFTNVANDIGLSTNVFAMGANFGDIDNDGFLDMYLGSGNPHFRSVIPNKMFKNIGGNKFGDVTASARVGHLQKGHGVSFADMDNDGDQDIYIEMGGAYPSDAYQNSFFLNSGQGNNNWICIDLEGTNSSRDAIGSRVKLTFRENGVTRSVYRDVNSGGSFGCSPLRREIGVGQATVIDEIEIRWHGSGEVQQFKNVKPNQFLKIKEGNDEFEVAGLKKITWILPEVLCLPLASN